MQPVKLNLGAGETEILGYTAIDRQLGTEAYPLDCEDGSVDEIRASHVLEHFSHTQVADVLNDWVAKLKPGGCIKIAVPDFEMVAKQYLGGEPINTQGFVMGGHCHDDDRHGCLFDRELLHEMMVNAGLERIGPWKSDVADCATLPITLNLKGFRPAHDKADLRGVVAVAGQARFGPALHHQRAYDAFHALKIPYHIRIGCFWSQLLCEAIEEQIAKPTTDYVLTLDYDTVFRPEDVIELNRIMLAYPEVDAVCATQSKRNGAGALFGVLDDEDRVQRRVYMAKFAGNVTKITTGHFGLTMFRANKLREFPRPWMVPCPNKEGRWFPNQIDPDIDFWLKWRDHGNSLWLANHVVVGHLEEVVTWPGEGFKPVHQNFGDYTRNGIPAEVQR